MKVRHIVIFLFADQIGLNVMRVNPVACCDWGNRVSDRIAVFGDDVIFVKAGQGDLVSLGNILACLNGQPVDFKLLTGGNRTQGYSHRITGVHFH
ncbi:hypothetical protein D3C80_1792370 [compost metagenome]